MKHLTPVLFVLFIPVGLFAQLATTFTVNSNKERQTISPYIYGTNGQSNDRPENITCRRLGGDRLTSYNWEDNFSNGGADYINDNDNYLPWNAGLPNSAYLTPNSVLSAFHDTSLAMNCSSLITLPMAGYVARDGGGVVSSGQAAPSARWRQVVNRKGSAFALKPDTTDNFIYVDECMNNLINQFGKSTAVKGIKCYEMDNEWSLWNSSDPLMHPAQPTIAEAIKKAVGLASTIKVEMDTDALVFAPSDYGFESYLNFQQATDWNSYSSYGKFSYAFMHYMKHASDSLGRRLLDVYDIHYYSSAQGIDSAGKLEVVDGGDNDTGVAIARMEAPRTLWDSTFIENSWIGQYYSPVALLPSLQYGVNQYYPGTKLGITEFSYGGENHISGGIACADMLGICGRFGIYWCNIWGPVNQYIGSAYKIFRNYDGKKSVFGGTHIYARPNSDRTASVYAALQGSDTNTMNVIAMNKDYDSTLVSTFKISANSNFTHAEVYGFVNGDTNIKHIGTVASITGNSFTYTIPKLSVYHFILTNNLSTGLTDIDNSSEQVIIYPNPSAGVFNIALSQVDNNKQQIDVLDVTGRLIKSYSVLPGTVITKVDLSTQNAGVYFARISSPNGITIKKLVKN
jgi:mannan endo-1,4-beta-mannosidase